MTTIFFATAMFSTTGEGTEHNQDGANTTYRLHMLERGDGECAV